MQYTIDIQYAHSIKPPVSDDEITFWASQVLAHQAPDKKNGELTVRVVESEEMQHLNHGYRNVNKPTNVLAFPSNIPDSINNKLDSFFWGDIILCPEIIGDEAKLYHQPIKGRWAHMIVHGILHLLGHDHVEEKEEQEMQKIEIQILEKFGFSNPYELEDK